MDRRLTRTGVPVSACLLHVTKLLTAEKASSGKDVPAGPVVFVAV